MSQLKEGLLPREAEKEVRFVDRSGNDERSYGRYNIKRLGVDGKFLFFEDWFHSFAALSTGTIIITILVAYFLSVLFWGFMFYEFREYGFIDVHNYLNACIISLETITTVGYTVTDISFHDEPVAFVLLYCEMMQSVMMNAFCIGVIYARLSRALTRARSILFSKKAVIREINGEWFFMFQICERRKHQLIESHVSCYSVEKAAVIDFNHFHDLVALDESHNYHDDIFIQTIN
ncbi:hypothetical protein AV274_3956 [Blastocystis sp. ATCC 50177/Nand II]|uniref:Uncharacterized protein n=1 Tax=Blastocystis sp. subtype 1 (strain ATCC 50177 / NandII) TaxID=478820 RepID=A0A196SDI0_BLAHN|nr:hypothetical protein AV274_3956 [Blastocystis sp. ATCC 50177/Nand II]